MVALMHTTDGQAVLCPPERSIPIDWLTLKLALKEETAAELSSAAASARRPSKKQQVFGDLLKLLELLTLLQYAEDARYIQAAMKHACPRLTTAEQTLLAQSRSRSSSVPPDQRQLEQELIDAIVRLLLRARYTPLTQQEWALAHEDYFTFDIPVTMDCSALDDNLLGTFWSRQERARQQQQHHKQHLEQQQQQQQQQGQTPAGGASSASHAELQQVQQASAAQPAAAGKALPAPSRPLLSRQALPSFSDRLLVFHRGVGVATAPGLYLTQKLDLLLDYLLVEPLTRFIDGVTAAIKGTASDAAVPGPEELGQQQQPVLASSSSSSSSSSSIPTTISSSADAEARVLSGSGDLNHPAARVVVRRSLRSLMPGPRQVLDRFWEPLVLQEPTYRSVIVLYRTSPPPAPAAASGTASVLESLLGAALLAASKDWLAMDAAVEAAAAAAAVKSSRPATPRQQSSQDEASGEGGGDAGEAGGAPPAEQGEGQDVEVTPEVAPEVRYNPLNIVIKSFADVALADMELVMPSKKVQLQPTIVLRTALTALGAVGAAGALFQQESAANWSLVLLPAVGLVLLRAVKILTTINTHQASLTSTMLSMAYNAARDSQEGVLCKLVDELRDNNTKEAALAVTALLTHCWAGETGTQAGQKAAAGAASEASTGDSAPANTASISQPSFSEEEVERACEAFLERRFGTHVDFTLEDTLHLLLQWGILREVTEGRYELRPLPEAVRRLKAQSLLQRVMQIQDTDLSSSTSSSPMASTEEVQSEQGAGKGVQADAAGTARQQLTVPAAVRIRHCMVHKHHGGGGLLHPCLPAARPTVTRKSPRPLRLHAPHHCSGRQHPSTANSMSYMRPCCL